MYTGLLKEYFYQIVNKDINFVKITPCRGSAKSLTSLCCTIMIWFKRDHPIIAKIPFINWIIYKKIFRNEIYKMAHKKGVNYGK